MSNFVWVEKYRPRLLSHVIFQDEHQAAVFDGFVKAGELPNIMLTGVQGTGKTTISRALMRELKVSKADVLQINCSDKKIEAVRNEVTDFAMTMPFGKFKVVRLEEIDYLSLDAQGLLRALIEDTSATCRFIATCNYANRVMPPLKSRFQIFHFKNPNKEKVALLACDILEKEGVAFDPEVLLNYIDVAYPDIRSLIQLLQSNSINGQLIAPTALTKQSDWKFGLLDCISTGDFKQARKLVCESATREEHEDVYRFLYDNISKLAVSNKDAAVITIAEYLYKHSIVADTEINLAALFIALGNL